MVKVQKLGWKSYEQLAETIFSTIEPNAVVKHDDSIYGHDSGIHRQIDVSIRSKIGDHDTLTIVQARDRKRAPDVNAVGEFATVVRDVRAHNGVMVCRKPPTKSAKKLAKVYNIELCSAFDVNDHKWSQEIAIPVVATVTTGEIEPSFTFPSASGYNLFLPPRPAPGYVSCDGGATRITLLEYLLNQAADKGICDAGAREFEVRDDSLRILLSDSANEYNWVPLPHILVMTDTSVRKLFRHCRPAEYMALKNYSTGDLTITEMKLELPSFGDSNAWQMAADLKPYDKVAEYVPIVDLQFSAMVRSGTYGVRVLPTGTF